MLSFSLSRFPSVSLFPSSRTPPPPPPPPLVVVVEIPLCLSGMMRRVPLLLLFLLLLLLLLVLRRRLLLAFHRAASSTYGTTRRDEAALPSVARAPISRGAAAMPFPSSRSTSTVELLSSGPPSCRGRTRAHSLPRGERRTKISRCCERVRRSHRSRRRRRQRRLAPSTSSQLLAVNRTT